MATPSMSLEENEVQSYLGEVNEVQSSFLSLVKHISSLNIMIDGSLKVKRRTLIITSCEASSKEKIEDGQASFYYITVREADNLEAETGSTIVPGTLENAEAFQYGLANEKSLDHYFPLKTNAWLRYRIRA